MLVSSRLVPPGCESSVLLHVPLLHHIRIVRVGCPTRSCAAPGEASTLMSWIHHAGTLEPAHPLPARATKDLSSVQRTFVISGSTGSPQCRVAVSPSPA